MRIGAPESRLLQRAEAGTLNDAKAVTLKATATPRIDDGRVIATEWRMPPGSETGWHRHEHDYAVVYLTSGTLLVESKDGNVSVPLERGQVTSRQAGVEHNVKNANEFEFIFGELEIKRGGAI